MKSILFSIVIFLPALAYSESTDNQTKERRPVVDTDATMPGAVMAAFTPSDGKSPGAGSSSETGPGISVDEARQRYAKEFIWFEDSYLGSWRPAWRIRGTFAYQGRHKERLDGVRFYQAVGRDDLASRYQTRVWSRRAIIGLGIGAFVGGAAYGLLGQEDCTLGSGFDECVSQNGSRIRTGAIVGIIGSGVAIAGFFFINPHPVPAHEARALADAYNTRLRQELGLPTDFEAKPMSYRLRVSPVVTPERGGVIVSGQF